MFSSRGCEVAGAGSIQFRFNNVRSGSGLVSVSPVYYNLCVISYHQWWRCTMGCVVHNMVGKPYLLARGRIKRRICGVSRISRRCNVRCVRLTPRDKDALHFRPSMRPCSESKEAVHCKTPHCLKSISLFSKGCFPTLKNASGKGNAFKCKAFAVLRSEAYFVYAAVTKDDE
jgi:hypothetical protein